MHPPSSAAVPAPAGPYGRRYGYGAGYDYRSQGARGPFARGPFERGPFSWPRRAEAWLDRKGRGAWIAAMVLGFIFFWPIGLFLVLYITYTQRWSHEMFGHSCRNRRMNHDDREDGRNEGHRGRHWGRGPGWGRGWDHAAFRPSGNAAFDDYKTKTLRRLEEEQEAFESFLQRLREAKDKKEFDAFMEDRARMNREGDQAAPEAGPSTGPSPDQGGMPGGGGSPSDAPRRGEY